MNRSTGQPWQSLALFCLTSFDKAYFTGATHEMMRPDRDLFVKILRKNLLPGDAIAKNFKLKGPVNYSDRDTPFDFNSVMMYGPTDFGEPNGAGQWKTTIEPLQPGIEIRCLKKSCTARVVVQSSFMNLEFQRALYKEVVNCTFTLCISQSHRILLMTLTQW